MSVDFNKNIPISGPQTLSSILKLIYLDLEEIENEWQGSSKEDYIKYKIGIENTPYQE